MGLPLIGHLARKGFPTSATDLDASRKGQIEQRGASWQAGAADLAAACDVVLVCVGYDHQVRELLQDPRLLSSAQPASIYAVLSTVQPETVQCLSTQCLGKGIQVVDATMCRGGKAADEGRLLSFVGGEPAVVERLRPVLSAFSSDIVHTGGVGSAQVAKAVNNLIMWACLVADHEGLALAQRYGLDVETLRSALLGSSAANNALANWGAQTMAWAEDDMAIVAEMAARCGLSLPQSGVTREICRALKPRRYRLDRYGR
jgi:3-hydroxyisobutyrate dehydrogenase